MTMTTWAEKEVELACKREKEAANDTEEWGYGCACYDSALKAFRSLMQDGHSGCSIIFTKHILNRLIDGKCLTPIQDTEDIWEYVFERNGAKVYHCTRQFSLFKDVYEDGTVVYNDIERFVMYTKGSNAAWHNSFVQKIAQEYCPSITFPYVPEDKPYEVYCEDFLTDPKNGDYDTQAILYVVYPNGEKKEINRYFKESEEGLVEIDKAEYLERVVMDQERQNKNN